MNGDRPTPWSTRRTLIGLAIGIPVSVVFLWLSIRGIDEEATWSALSEAKIHWIVVALAALAGFFVAQGWRWSVFLRSVGGVAPAAATGAVVAAAAVSNTLPGRPGDLLRAWWASRVTGRSVASTASTVVLDRVADLIVLVSALAVAASQSPPRRGLEVILLGAIVLSGALMLLVVLAFVYVTSPRGRARASDDHPRSRLRRAASQFLRGLARVTPAQAAAAFALTLVAWGCFAITAWATANSVGIDLGPQAVVMLTAALNLGIAIPSSPGFIGTYQWLTIAAIEPYGIGRSQAFAFSLLLHAVTLLPPTCAGYVLIAREVRSGRLDGGWRSPPATEIDAPSS